MKWVILCLVILASAAGVLAYQNFCNQPAGKDTTPAPREKLLIVGESWPPFEYEEGGKLKGIDVEALEQVFSKLGVPYEIRLYPWVRADMMAKNGEVDMVISVSYNKEREGHLFYTDSQREFSKSGKMPEDYLWGSEYVFFCRKIYAEKIKYESYGQLKADGYKVGTIKEYTYNSEFMAAHFPTFLAPDITTSFHQLKEGKIDLLPCDRAVGLATIKLMGLQDDITFLPKVMFAKPYLIPFCKKSPWPDKEELQRKIYAGMAELRKSGEYDKIRSRYIK